MPCAFSAGPVAKIARSGATLALLAFSCLSVLLAAPFALADDRVALVISNAQYQAARPLENPPRDAQLIAEALRDAGFTKIIQTSDLGLDSFRITLEAFRKEAEQAQVAVVYFAGHGVEVDKKNFLVPVDAAIKMLSDIPEKMVSLDQVKSSVQSARRLKMIILDACRNDPFAEAMADAAGLRSGLANPSLSETNLVVIYAAGEGQRAKDGQTGQNSPFAQAMASRLAAPGMEISLLIRNVHDDVRRSTASQQSPAVYQSLSAEPFYFIAPPPDGPFRSLLSGPVPPSARMAMELEFWKATADLNEPELYQVYLDKVASGEFSGVYSAIARLKATPQTVNQKDRDRDLPLSSERKQVLENEVRAAIKNAQSAAERNDTVTAAREYERAAISGATIPELSEIASNAALLSGVNYLSAGARLPKTVMQAARMLKLGTELGNSGAAAAYTYMLRTGHGVAKDEEEARRILKGFAEAGDVMALARYGQMLMNGEGGASDVDSGRSLIKTSAEQGSSFGMLFYADIVRREEGDGASLRWYRSAAEKGNTKAMLALGRLLLWSKTVATNRDEALQWLEKAGDELEVDALYELAQIYVQDPATLEKGAQYAGIASSFGDFEHRLFYAELLEEGRGVPKNLVAARAQYEVVQVLGNSYYRKRAELEIADLDAKLGF